MGGAGLCKIKDNSAQQAEPQLELNTILGGWWVGAGFFACDHKFYMSQNIAIWGLTTFFHLAENLKRPP